VEQNGKWIFRIDQGFVDPGVPEEATTSVPVEEPSTPSASTTPTPIVAGSECDPNMCELVGHCTTYFTCDPRSRRRVSWECSEGLFWNPKKPKMPSYAGLQSTTWQPLNISAPTWGSGTNSTFAPSGPVSYWNGTNYSPSSPPAAYPTAPAGYYPSAAGRQLYPYTSTTYAPSSPAYTAPYVSSPPYTAPFASAPNPEEVSSVEII